MTGGESLTHRSSRRLNEFLDGYAFCPAPEELNVCSATGPPFP
jgi:hypothetical protein